MDTQKINAAVVRTHQKELDRMKGKQVQPKPQPSPNGKHK